MIKLFTWIKDYLQQPTYKYYLVYYWSQNGWSEVINAFQFDSKVPLNHAAILLCNHFRDSAVKSEKELRVIRTNDYLVGRSSRDFYYSKPRSLGKYTSKTLPQKYETIKYFSGYCTKVEEMEIKDAE